MEVPKFYKKWSQHKKWRKTCLQIFGEHTVIQLSFFERAVSIGQYLHLGFNFRLS